QARAPGAGGARRAAAERCCCSTNEATGYSRPVTAIRAARVIRGLLLVAAALLAPGSAGADTFCGNHAGCPDAGHNFTTLGAAIDAGDGNDGGGPVKDTVLVGTGEFDPFSTHVGHPVDVAGSGFGTVVRVSGDTGSSQTLVTLKNDTDTVHALTVRLPSGGG